MFTNTLFSSSLDELKGPMVITYLVMINTIFCSVLFTFIIIAESRPRYILMNRYKIRLQFQT